MKKVSKKSFEKYRKSWAKLAKENDWYSEPFFIQVWINSSGKITNAVSFRDIKQDWVCDDETEVILTENVDYVIE